MTSWQSKKLGEVADIYDGTHQTPKYQESGVPFYSVEQVTSDNFTDTKFISEDIFVTEPNKIEKGDILMTRIGDIGTARYIDWNVRASYYVSLALIKTKPEVVAPRFLAYYISTYSFQKELRKRSLLVAFPFKINLNDIGKCQVVLPSIEEQKAIVEKVRDFDEYLKLVREKIARSEELKKGVAQRIFAGEMRFKDDNGDDFPEPEEKRLGDVLIKNSTRNKNSAITNVQSISKSFGFVKQSDYFEGRTIASKDLSNYFVIAQGIFAYNPSRIDVGSLAYKYDDETSVISPLYISFKAKQNYLNDAYLLEWFFASEFIRQMNNFFEGSVRHTLSYDALKAIKINLPPLPEQRKIADFLSGLEDEIKALRNLLSEAEKQKKWLLDNLITGKIRLPEFDDNKKGVKQ